MLWGLFGFLAVGVGLYPSLYLINERNFALLSGKSQALLANVLWNIGFYTHIFFGGIALLIGWLQFSKRLRNKQLSLHRNIGKAYVVFALLSGLASIYIGFYTFGGTVATLGFICLGIIWVLTTVKAYLAVRKKDLLGHQRWMIYSYAACFAAVTLRLWLPLLQMTFDEFDTAYRIVAWLCWVPNIFVAYLITRKLGNTSTTS